MIQRLAILVLGLTLALGVAACGGDDNGNGEATETDTTEETTTGEESDAFAAGRAVFIENCGTCHTLSEAETSGAVGPELDGIGLSAEDIEAQVRSGGGAMPSFEGTLSDEEISNVAAYVAEASGG